MLGGKTTQNVKFYKFQSHSSVSDSLQIIPAKEKRTKLNKASESEGGFCFSSFILLLEKLHFLASVMCFGTLCTHTLSTFRSHSQGQSYCFLLWTDSAAQEDVISQMSCAEAMESSDYQA